MYARKAVFGLVHSKLCFYLIAIRSANMIRVCQKSCNIVLRRILMSFVNTGIFENSPFLELKVFPPQ